MMMPLLSDPDMLSIADKIILALQNLAPGESPWWAWLPAMTPLAALVAAAVAAFFGWRNLKAQQRALAESQMSNARSEWWKRTQWALDASVSLDPKMATYGASFLTILANSSLAGAEETALLEAAEQQIAPAIDAAGADKIIEDALRFGYEEGVDSAPEPADNGSSKEVDHGRRKKLRPNE